MFMFQRANAAIAILATAGAAAAADSQYQAPRTPWGVPDLQGTWTNASLTSLERDDMFKGKATLNDAEAAQFERSNAFAQFSANDARPTDPSVQQKAGTDPGGYNAFWLDPGTQLASVRGEHRTSFIVEPQNGKVPYTPDGLKAFQAARAGLNMDGPERRALGERCLLGFGSTSGPPGRYWGRCRWPSAPGGRSPNWSPRSGHTPPSTGPSAMPCVTWTGPARTRRARTRSAAGVG